MIMDSIANRYASALLTLAIEEKQVFEYQEQMRLIKAVFVDNDELLPFLDHCNIHQVEKKSFLDKLLKNSINVNILNFMKLLIDKNRCKSIIEICNEFKSLCNDYLDVKEGIIYSTKALTPKEILEITNTINKKMNARVELSNQIDSSLLGGFKVVVKDTIFDHSIINKLQSMKYELLDGKR